jgi:putative secretion ATPase (PEP-CTERM system associated)
MYESHFGLSGPPFQLVPDPGFFFGSRGHSNALAFLKSAAHQGDGFLVVTGEIGAGKTTLVRTLLESLDAARVQAATMVSTQLESGDLPLAILLAFGVAQATQASKSELNAALEAFLIDLAAKGRRALLIVDEAQNLSRALVEELRMLSNLQLGTSALLQVFLVGQPELRTQMQGKAMEQLRQRVTASCHLGPMDGKETRAYVEHRLRRVGWVDRPPIESFAFEQIHQWTAGIPRRINRLCNRLLLATFLEGKDSITAEAVEQIARDLRAEIGESDEQPKMEESYVTSADPAPSSAASGSSSGALAAAAVPLPDPLAASADEPSAVTARVALPAVAALDIVESPAPPATILEAPKEAIGETLPSAPARFDPALIESILIEPGSVATASAGPALAESAETKPSVAVVADEPVVDEEDEQEGRPAVRTPAPSVPVTPAGVVAAHEPAMPPLKSLLGQGQAVVNRTAGARGSSPSPTPILASKLAPPLPPTSMQGGMPAPTSSPALTPESPGLSATVDVPLDFTTVSAAPIRPPAASFGPSRAPIPASLPRPGETGTAPTLAPTKPVLEPLVCLVDSPSDYVKARALGRVLSEHRDLPSVLIVHTASVANLEVGEEIAGVMPQKASDVHLDINEHGGAASAALAITRFDAVLRVYRPKAIIAMGTSDTLLTCALFAHKSGIPILRNDAGRRRAWSRPGEEMNALLLERLADTSYISDLATFYTLYRSGISTDRVLLVGNLVDNVLHFAALHRVHPADILRRVGTSVDLLAHPQGYALCTAQLDVARAGQDDAAAMISMLTLVGRELPVLWATNDATLHELKSQGKLAGLKAARIDVAPALRYLDCIDLLRGARCLLAGSNGHCLDDAVTLGVPSVVLGPDLVVPVKSTEALQLSSPLGVDQLPAVLAELLANPVEPREKAPVWDGATAGRIATHLGEWLPTHAAGKKRGKPALSVTQRPKHPDAAIELLGTATG